MNFNKLLLSLLIFLCLFSSILEAQILKPAKWSTEASDKTVAIGDEIDLIFKVEIQDNWYLYSTDFDPDLGPIVTKFVFTSDNSYELVGEVKPIGAKEKYDEYFDGNYTYFTKTAEFRQTIKILKKDPVIKGTYAYQVCSDIDGKCISFDDEFEFSGFTVTGGAGSEPEQSIPAETTASSAKQDISPVPNVSEDTLAVDETSDADSIDKTADTIQSKITVESNQKKSKLLQREADDPYSLLTFMVLAFLGGLAALLTPCVFPMIPMTVTFFTSHSKNRRRAVTKALVYGMSILVIYVLAGTVVAVINGPEFANWLSTHWVPNVFFFVVFFIFGLSFLGLFEITLPSGLVNTVDRESDKGGYYGVFFMAFTLVLVSFSCTGPIVGSILVEAAGGQVLKPVLGMFAFALAFAVPFTLFAIFPEWLNSLPKSGGWLNAVKVSLGFLELALGLKFLSIADQVYHWGILDRDVYLVLWIVIFFFLGLYLLGKIRLPHDSKMEAISVPRLLLAIIVFSFTLYLVPGLFGAPLKPLAGYLPPMTTQDFNIPGSIGEASLSSSSGEEGLCEQPKYGEFLHLPHGLKGYFDYEQALACAKEQNKPLFIDFTGHGCVNCREMEARVWSDPAVLERLRNDYVVVALYVDEKTELEEAEWYTSTYDNKVKSSIGKQNADFQISKFENNAQPFYVLLGHDEEPLMPPLGYDLNIHNFINYLDSGLEEFKGNLNK